MLVAPYVGAWIETYVYRLRGNRPSVAPYVGAWIETRGLRLLVMMVGSHPTWVRGLKHVERCPYGRPCASHPTWVRGLKLNLIISKLYRIFVAPYVGAWIETLSVKLAVSQSPSHPTWVRGLKLDEW